MKRFIGFSIGLYFIFNITSVFAGDLNRKSKLYLNHYQYDSARNNINSIQDDLYFYTSLGYQGDAIKLKAVAIAQKDPKDSQRTFFIINEFNIKYRIGRDYELSIGKEVLHAGSLNEYNVVDIYNVNNYLIDPLGVNKKGSLGVSLARFIDEHSITLRLRAVEESLQLPSKQNPFNFLQGVNYDTQYKTEKGKYRPALFIQYAGQFDNFDIEMSYMNGYDNQRDIIINNTFTASEYLYLVEKYMADVAMSSHNMLYNMELTYTDIKNYTVISNYAHLGIGMEYKTDMNNTGISYIAEYYKYVQKDGSRKRPDELNQVFQNDIALGLNIDFSGARHSSFKTSFVLDLQGDENFLKLEYNKKINDSIELAIKYIQLKGSNTRSTYFSRIGDLRSLSVGISSYF